MLHTIRIVPASDSPTAVSATVGHPIISAFVDFRCRQASGTLNDEFVRQ